MPRLPLDDPRWASLDHRAGSAGDVPDELRHLLEHPEDTNAFSALWPDLCSEGTAYPAAFAAVPYVVDIAERLPPGRRVEPSAFLGLVRIGTEPNVGIPGFLTDAYEASRLPALSPIAAELLFEHHPSDTQYLLAAAAALKGYPKIVDIIQALEFLQVCPECGAELLDIED